MGPLDRPEEAEGASLETLLYHELKAANSYLNLGYEIFYWRTVDDAEVDFVLYGKRGIKAFEIKRTARINKSMFGGLKSFLKQYPMVKAYLVYGGSRRMREGNIEIYPVGEFLENLSLIL